MKNTAMLACADAGEEARLQAALEVVRAIDGHLTCLEVVAPALPLVDAFSQAGLGQVARDRCEDAIAHREALTARLSREDVRFDWVTREGRIVSSVEQGANLADLLVLSLPKTGSLPTDQVVADLVVRTGKPILAVPVQLRSLNVRGGRAMIAWDGSDQAARALTDAVPLLRVASDITIVQIVTGASETSGEDAARYLSRHGMKPSLLTLNGMDDYVPPLLIRQAKALRADYIVMGGFGSWRLIERMFRGNTHWLLTASPLPLFIAH